MRLRLRTKRPTPWSDYRNNTRHGWAIPFVAIEWLCEWVAHFLSNWSFLDILDYVRSLGIIVVVVFYFYQSNDRVTVRHYQAWQVINTAQGKGGNGGRVEALEELNLDRVPLVGVDVSGAFLQGLHLEKGNLARSNLNAADVRDADLRSTDFRDSDLRSANFRGCRCVKVSFKGSALDGADLWGADLSGADLTDATLADADLRDANLLGIDWKHIKSLKMTNIANVRNPPEGFVSWALHEGAVQDDSDSQ
jgi:hypothetical protein